MNRRQLLKYGVSGAALLAIGSFPLSRWMGNSSVRPQRKLSVLDELAFAVVVAAVRPVLARESDEVAVAHRVDDALRFLPAEAQADFVDMTRALNSPLVGILDGRPIPFINLDVEKRFAALQSWSRSSIPLRRQGYVAMKRLVGASYYVDESAWPQVGYPGPPTLSVDP